MQADYTKPDAHTKEAYNSTKDMPSYNLQVYKKNDQPYRWNNIQISMGIRK